MAREITMSQLVTDCRGKALREGIHLCGHDISAVAELLSSYERGFKGLRTQNETLTRQLASAHSQITQLALEIDALKNPSKTKQRLADLEARVTALESI